MKNKSFGKNGERGKLEDKEISTMRQKSRKMSLQKKINMIK